MANLFTHFKIQPAVPNKGQKAFRFNRGEGPKMLQRQLASGLWEIYLSLGQRCCIVGSGGGDRARGFTMVGLDLVDNCESMNPLYEFQMFHRSRKPVSLVGEIHKDYYEGFAMVGDRWPTERFPWRAVSRKP